MRVEHLNLSPEQISIYTNAACLSAAVCGPCFKALAEPTKEVMKKLLMCPFLQVWEQHASDPRSH